MVKEIELSIPQSWEDITLKKYLNLMNELKNYEGEDEAQFAVMLQILCGLDAEYLKGISIADYNLIKNELNNFIGSMDSTLHRFITIDGVEYGFEPNLSEMAYGAYVDITQYSEIAINDNWAKIMNILYRPVTSKNSIYYTIETYTGDYNYEKWLNVSMDKHFGALFFLLNLSMDLAKNILSYSMEMDLTPSIKQLLQKSGEVIQQSTNLQMETFLNMTKSLKNH
jgi:hypothetical protein